MVFAVLAPPRFLALIQMQLRFGLNVKKSDWSRTSIDDNNKTLGNCGIKITSGSGAKSSTPEPIAGEEIAFDFDSNCNNVAMSAHALARVSSRIGN